MKKAFLLLAIILISFSCKKDKEINTQKLSKETSETFINFDKYTFNTADNTREKITLSKKTSYILDFWYLECEPCVKQHKEIKEYQDILAKNNTKVIGVSIDRSQKNWRNYLKKHQYNWQNYNQFQEENDLKYDLNIKFFPRYYYVNDKGFILRKFNSFKQVINYLKIEK